MTSAPSRIATSCSGGTAEASTRCSQPMRSRRLPNTWRNPESVSMTAIRSPFPPWRPSVICRAGYWTAPTQAHPPHARSQLVHKLFAGISAYDGVRGIAEFAEETGHDERRLLADVDGVVADALQRPAHERHVHRPLARVDVVADLDRHLEQLAVDAVDVAV